MEKIGFFTTEIPEELSFLSNRISLPGEYFYYGAARAAFEPEIEKCINSMKNTLEKMNTEFEKIILPISANIKSLGYCKAWILK